VDFRILGPVEVRAQGRPLAVAGGRQRALLALLLLRAGEPVSRDRLIEGLWGERPPEGAVKTVQAVVSRLRRALGGEAARLVSGTSGYRLRVEPDELDLARFERLCGEGRRALAAGRPERAAARLRAALEEWRGPALADVALEPFAPSEVARLEELRAAAVEDRNEADLALGRGVELVGELEALLAREPLRERLRAQLMLALYRAGRQGEALDAYRDSVRTLDAELGLRPGPELESLQRAILAHDPALLRSVPAARRGASVVGVDRSPGMLAVASELSPELDFRRADACALPFKDGSFDAVTCGLAVSHFADRDRALREILRVLAPAGRFVASAWGEGSRFPDDGIDKLLDRYGAPAPSEALDEATWQSPERGGSVLRRAGFANVSFRSESFDGNFADAEEALAWSLGWPLIASRLDRLDSARRERFRRESLQILAGSRLSWRFVFNFYLANKSGSA
jgi:DNA-binding SARP family transcriptional activator/trans-aconitate methyltransferase